MVVLTENSMDFPPDTVASEQPLRPEPDRFMVVSRDHGTYEAYVNRELADGATKYENEFSMEVPQSVLDICERVRAMGGRAFLVGGCVRDMVISAQHPAQKLKIKDYDVEIYGLDIDPVHRMLSEAYEKADLEGAAFAAIKVKTPDQQERVDVVFTRHDSKVALGNSGFTINTDPTMNMHQAAKRRDLGINALLYDPLEKIVYDPFGGVDQIKRQEIDIVDPETFVEDPLRVLRVMQFASRFGFNITERTQNLCKELMVTPEIDALVVERVSDEMHKLLEKGAKPSLGLKFAKEMGLLEKFWPEMNNLNFEVLDNVATYCDRLNLDSPTKLEYILGAIACEIDDPENLFERQSMSQIPKPARERALLYGNAYKAFAQGYQLEVSETQSTNESLLDVVAVLKQKQIQIADLYSFSESYPSDPQFWTWFTTKTEYLLAIETTITGAAVMKALGLTQGGPQVGQALQWAKTHAITQNISAEQALKELEQSKSFYLQL